MRENRMKWVPYAQFWENIKLNTSLLKINVSKTELSDRVVEKLVLYLANSECRLADLDLSRNTITDHGLVLIGNALLENTSLKYLNLSQN